jgi:transcriptional regulator with XRE-family HTH domain
MVAMLKKIINPIDRHVGSRARMRRMLIGMSQEKLGNALGLTFQQVQKYEKGANRISASRLQQMSGILNVPVSFFFEGAPSGDTLAQGNGDAAPDISAFLSTAEGIQLNQAFAKIKSSMVRRRIVDLVEALAETNQPI